MTTIERDEFKTDPVWNKMFQILRDNHKVASHTERTLIANRFTKDFCEEARHFCVIDKFFLHYDVASWYKEPNGVQCKIDRFAIYDTQEEYEKARRKELNSTINADGANLN